MSGTDKTTMAVVGAACVACCLPLIVTAGPVVAVGAAAAAVTGGVAYRVRRRNARPDEPAARPVQLDEPGG